MNRPATTQPTTTWPPPYSPYPWPPPWWPQPTTDPMPQQPGGTRSVTPLSPGDFPGGTGGPTQQPGSPMPQQTTRLTLTDAERSKLKVVLDFLKAHPGGRTFSDKDKQLMMLVVGYLSGFLDAKGITPPPTILGSIIGPSGGGSSADTPYDAMVKSLESLISNTDTRIMGVDDMLIGLALAVAGAAIWDGIKWLAD